MANKTIYDLTENQTLDADDLFEQDVLQNNERKSLKTTLRAIADKIITSLTYNSLNTTSKTVVGAINELEQGGGGTGGHTIIDENGNTMTARSGLQFTGNVVVTDDGTNNKTIVSVLSGAGHNYSTTEQIVGTWNDKTVYGKLFELESSLLINADSWGNTPISNSDKSAIIDVKLWDTNGTLFTQIGANRDNSSGYVQILNSRNSAISINKIYLEYTKTS